MMGVGGGGGRHRREEASAVVGNAALYIIQGRCVLDRGCCGAGRGEAIDLDNDNRHLTFHRRQRSMGSRYPKDGERWEQGKHVKGALMHKESALVNQTP